MSLSWSDITYDIPLPKKKAKEDRLERARQQDDLEIGTKISNDTFPLEGGYRRILAGVGGEVKQGQLVAILGATGAGKTTLLNILSARLSSVGKLQGRVLFHGKERDPQTWKRTVGFVEQDDVMLGLLTVQETLGYSAKMRLPDKLYTKEQKKQRVQETIDMLRLQKCSQTRIGSTTKRGISGGERKRTSIGVELVSDVSLLLLDEPTSGLDAYAAYSVVENLKNTARLRNLSCLMTIHQPSWRLLQLVDRVQLLARGKLYYDGTPSDMQAWFESLNHKVPEGANPADYYITLAENADESEEGEKRIEHLIQAWASKEEAEKGTSTDTQIDKNVVSANENTSLEVYKNWPTSIFSEIAVLTSRNAKQIPRDRDTQYGTIGQTLVTLILVGFAFFRLGHSQTDVLARVGVLFFFVINNIFSVVFPVLLPFPTQRAIMMRERSAGTYRCSSFFFSKFLVEVPYNVLQRLPFMILFYWMVGLKSTAAAFFIFIGIGSILVVVAVCLGIFIGSVSRSVELANILAPMFTLIFLLFGGNLLPAPPPWFIWLRYISPLTYSYMALSQNEFTGMQFTCQGGSQCYSTGQQVLEQYHLQTFNIGECAGFLVAIAFAFSFIGYLGLRITAHPRFRYS